MVNRKRELELVCSGGKLMDQEISFKSLRNARERGNDLLKKGYENDECLIYEKINDIYTGKSYRIIPMKED